MDLTTTYLGMTLANPLVPSASPLSEEIDNIRRMEDAGAAAIVLYSLFEEQLSRERLELHHHLIHGTESFAEALTYFPEPSEFTLGPEGYLEHIRRAKEATRIPIIASLNGYSLGGWMSVARQMQEAGADAIELNIYNIPADPEISGQQVEETCVDIVRAVKSHVDVPVAVKLSPYYSSMAHMARRLDDAGADGLVLFNRFYQPDISLDNLEVVPHVLLSQPQAMRLPLRWVAMLHGRVRASLAATSGIHDQFDVLKMLLAGADVTMLCSTLLRNGVGQIATILTGLRRWMDEHQYESVQQMKGSMSHEHSENPAAYERAQYMRALHSVPAPD
ncbi:MAG: dihydroorotate dehydrogenase-like protein [Candidatus Zixiibacteriota bacterium]